MNNDPKTIALAYIDACGRKDLDTVAPLLAKDLKFVRCSSPPAMSSRAAQQAERSAYGPPVPSSAQAGVPVPCRVAKVKAPTAMVGRAMLRSPETAVSQAPSSAPIMNPVRGTPNLTRRVKASVLT